jgi:fluoride exporter
MPVIVAVAIGGAIGSALRWWLATDLTTRAGIVGIGTFAVNLAGAFALGLLVGLIEVRWSDMPRWAAAGLGVGILGGFTTFSAFALDFIRHVEDGRWLLGLTYVTGTVVIGLAVAVAGLMLGRATG